MKNTRRTGNNYLKSAKKVIFAFPPFESLASEMVKNDQRFQLGAFSVERFPNGEFRMELDTHVRNEHCVVLGSIAPPEHNMLSYLLLCHTLKEEGCETLVGILPYLAYSRHDRKEPGKSRGIALIGKMLAAAGVDAVVTVDAHSPFAKLLFPIPLISLSPSVLYAQELRKLGFTDVTVVAPDAGAIKRSKAVRVRSQAPGFAYLRKKRTKTGVVHGKIFGKITKKAVIVDDMIDTGATLISCAKALQKKGVKEIYVFATHGLFTGDAWKELWHTGVKSITTTNSVPMRRGIRSTKVKVISLVPLILKGLSYANKNL
jgi:ribose-phosphate pyrophosphokinase